MLDALHQIVVFVGWSSAQLLGLGLVVLAVRRIGWANPTAARRALALFVLFPLFSLAVWLLPLPAWLTVHTPLVVSPAPSVRAEALSTPRSDPVAEPVALVEGAAVASEARRPGGATAHAPFDPLTILCVIWLAGVVLVVLRAGHQARALHTLLRMTRRVRDPRVHSLLSSSAAQLGISRVPALHRSGRTDTLPFLVGVFRPTIVVPARLLATEHAEALRFALLHELAHLKHRDHGWILPESLLRAVYFFHPVLHVALSRLQEERECRADCVVARVCGRRAAYADFLLDEIETTRSRMPPAPALALGRGPGSMVRRIHRLLDRGESTMKHSVRSTVAAGLTLAAFLCLLGIAAAPVAADDVPASPFADARYDSINAVATDTEGVYRVYPVFEELLGVHVVPIGGPYDAEHRRELSATTDYTFDAAKGVLRFSVPVDAETEHVSVRGYRVLPWQWTLGRPFTPGSVAVTFKDRVGKRGEDFEVDEAAGTIRFLKSELCHRKQQYSITYLHPADPAKPDVTPGGTIGTYVAPPKSETATTGRGPAPVTPPHLARAVGTNATATSDPRTWTLAQPFASEGVRVAIAKRGAPGNLRWLKRAKDYLYDPAHGQIVLTANVTLDPKAEYVFVHGVPSDRGLVLRHRPIGDDVAIKVIVGTKRLAEGEGYEVDRPAGRVRILDAAIQVPRTPFYVQVGAWAYGSYSDRETLKKLLAD